MLRQVNLAWVLCHRGLSRPQKCFSDVSAAPILISRGGVEIIRACARVLFRIPRKIVKIVRREGLSV